MQNGTRNETIHLIDGADLIEEHDSGRWYFRQWRVGPYSRESVSFDSKAEALAAWPYNVTWEEWR